MNNTEKKEPITEIDFGIGNNRDRDRDRDRDGAISIPEEMGTNGSTVFSF